MPRLWRSKWLVWRERELAAEYGPAHAAVCIRQERLVADIFAMSPKQLETKYRASQERLRNLLGSDFEIVGLDGETKI